MNRRIIARLDIKGPNLVKGIHLEGLRVLGKPEDFARYYYENGIDELLYSDTVASLYGRNSLHDIITRTAGEIFIPLTVGGGIRSIKDIRNVLRAGADKVAINTAFIKNPGLIKEAAQIFGSSTIVAAIEAIEQAPGEYMALIDNGREYTGKDAVAWAGQLEQYGAGEILITSVNKEGTGLGFDTRLISKVSDVVNIPVIAHGGCGRLEHINAAFKDGRADAVALASILHYDYIKDHNKTSGFEKEGNIEFLKNGRDLSTIDSTTIDKIKKYLMINKTQCRI